MKNELPTHLLNDQAAELVDPDRVFHAPVATSAIDRLLASYAGEKAAIEELARVMAEPKSISALAHFMKGNSDDRYRHVLTGESMLSLLDPAHAVRSLDATYWGLALDMTDVLDAMPQKRRNEWSTMLREMNAPSFEGETVRATLIDLLSSRERFFAERVDGVFQALSKTHVTNSPEGFGRKLIITGLLDDQGSLTTRVGYISDLRNVVGRLMGRGEMNHYATSRALRRMQESYGQWHTLDAGAIRLKLHKNGSAHCEVHPEIAYRLNMALAVLHPSAIPTEFRVKPRAVAKHFPALAKALPFDVIDRLVAVRIFQKDGAVFAMLDDSKGAKHVDEGAREVLAQLGGVPSRGKLIEFDYNPHAAIMDVVITGTVPDVKSHQFYPSSDLLADYVAAEVGWLEGETVLEPSAGLGNLASRYPAENTTCVEVSALNCKVLVAKGFSPVCADFLSWSEGQGRTFDVAAMNPPFAGGRAELHVKAAARLVKRRLVAIVPPSLKGKLQLPGFDLSWSEVFHDQFAGASVSVVVLTADVIDG